MGKGKHIVRVAATTLTAALVISSTGCAIIPKEAKHDRSAIMKTDTIEYEYTYVQHGDLVKSDNVVCAYMAVDSVNYAFEEDGSKYAGVYVKVGDKVASGDLIAELDTTKAKAELAEQNVEREVLELEISYLEKEQSLMIEKSKLEESRASKLDKLNLTTPEEVKATYDIQINDKKYKLADLMEVIDSLENEIEAGKLYSTIDGTVTYSKGISADSTTVAGARVVTVSDINNSFFKASTRYYESFSVGDTGTVVIGKDEYRVEVVDAKDHGIEADENDVYFSVIGDTFTLNEGDKGTLNIVLESVSDTLYVPSAAISSLGDKKVVFYLNEDGVRTYKEVTTGAEINGNVQILEGVIEGEQLIIG